MTVPLCPPAGVRPATDAVPAGCDSPQRDPSSVSRSAGQRAGLACPPHHWLLSSPKKSQPTIAGVCRLCGATRECDGFLLCLRRCWRKRERLAAQLKAARHRSEGMRKEVCLAQKNQIHEGSVTQP